jgi:pimeloyl-ACP methyl ester carboxylesterase
MKTISFAIILVILFGSCQKENITMGTKASDTFYLDNNGSSMYVLVEGNTLSHAFLIFVHGGPGSGAEFYNTKYISQNIENKYACVYWDQRNAGASQGSSNGDKLNLPQMTDDLKKLIELIKYRYGENSSVFILGHSFGGLLATSFMTTGNNQLMVKGWIFVDGCHNYPLNDTLTRQTLLKTGEQQIALNNNKTNWTPIVSYCETHTGNFSLPESDQLESYAGDAETYFPEVKPVNLSDFVGVALNEDWPITSILFNYLYSDDASINKQLAVTEFSSSLYKITSPTLLLFGKYDFICPKEMGYDILNRIGSTDVRMEISPISGHYMMFQDEAFFCNEVDNFIELHK